MMTNRTSASLCSDGFWTTSFAVKYASSLFRQQYC